MTSRATTNRATGNRATRNRPGAILFAGALLAVCLVPCACTRRGKGLAGARADDCYSTAGAVACPPDPAHAADPSGKLLPRPGGVCTLPPCKVCGSATAPSYRDFAGASQVGWCICVPRSDDSGISTYSCFGTGDWPHQSK